MISAVASSALRPADRGDDGTLGEMLARAVLDSLYKFIVPAGPARLVSLPVLANKASPSTHFAQRLHADGSKLPEAQTGRWRSSRDARSPIVRHF